MIHVLRNRGMFKSVARQSRSERRGEEVQTALCVGHPPLQWILANGEARPVLPGFDEFLITVIGQGNANARIYLIRLALAYFG